MSETLARAFYSISHSLRLDRYRLDRYVTSTAQSHKPRICGDNQDFPLPLSSCPGPSYSLHLVTQTSHKLTLRHRISFSYTTHPPTVPAIIKIVKTFDLPPCLIRPTTTVSSKALERRRARRLRCRHLLNKMALWEASQASKRKRQCSTHLVVMEAAHLVLQAVTRRQPFGKVSSTLRIKWC